MTTYTVVLHMTYTVVAAGWESPKLLRQKIRQGTVAADLLRPVPLPLAMAADCAGRALYGVVYSLPSLLLVGLLRPSAPAGALAGTLFPLSLLGKAAADVIGESLLLLPELVRTGELDRALTRPLPVLFQVLTTPHQAPGGGGILAVALATVALPQAPVDWSPLRIAVLAGGVAGAAAIQLAFRLLTGATAFWLLEADDLRELLHDLITEFGRYPTAIFARPIQWLLHVVPAGFIAYYPSAWLLGRDGALLPVALGAALSPVAAAAWRRFATGAWRTGLRRYTSTGS